MKRHLVAADRASIRRIECKDCGLASQVAQRQNLIGRYMQHEIRRGGSRGEDVRHFRPLKGAIGAPGKVYGGEAGGALTAVNRLKSFP